MKAGLLRLSHAPLDPTTRQSIHCILSDGYTSTRQPYDRQFAPVLRAGCFCRQTCSQRTPKASRRRRPSPLARTGDCSGPCDRPTNQPRKSCHSAHAVTGDPSTCCLGLNTDELDADLNLEVPRKRLGRSANAASSQSDSTGSTRRVTPFPIAQMARHRAQITDRHEKDSLNKASWSSQQIRETAAGRSIGRRPALGRSARE